jgi:predicted transcriptional regulator of viral defense system
MGKQIHLKKIEELFDKSQTVDFKSIERIIGSKKGNYAKLMIYNLLKKGKINKIGKGIYTKYPESSLSVFAFTPSYLGLQNALSFYGLWEQETIPVILTTKKVRRGIRKIMNSNILVRNIDKKHFFGFELVKEGNFYLPYSDLEKTFIDMVVFNQRMDDEIISNIKKRINKEKLNRYLRRYGIKVKNKVNGLL